MKTPGDVISHTTNSPILSLYNATLQKERKKKKKKNPLKENNTNPAQSSYLLNEY
jgi:hypothetical protein